MEYQINLGIIICIYLILAMGYNLNFGLGGSFNLAHVASYAIGAYATAILSTRYGFNFAECLAASFACSAVMAMLVGAVALRLSHDYFAIGTLAFSSVISALLINWTELTNGVLGITGIPRPEFWGIDFSNNKNFLILIAIFTVISLAVMRIIFNSPFSRTLKAQSEFVHGAQAVGKNASLANTIGFILASGMAALAGAFFAYYINFIDPSTFSLGEMIFVFTIIVVGRPGSFTGCVLATISLVLLPEALRFVDIPPSVLGPLRQLIYSAILMGVVYYNRAKLFPVERKI